MTLAELSPHSPFVLSIVGFLGAAIGSFLTLVTHRLPLEQGIVVKGSHCPKCGNTLKPWDLVPILSWIFWRGRCRQCKVPVSIRYPLTELACALGAVLLVFHFGLTLQALALIGLWWCIVAIVLTDLEHYIILDEVQIAGALFGVLYVYATNVPWIDALYAAIAGVAVGLALKYGFLLACKKDGLGMGDVKFLGVAGIWLTDAANFIPFLFYSGILGILSGLLWRVLTKSERFPFGPALAFALWLCVLFPQLPNGFWQLYGVLR